MNLGELLLFIALMMSLGNLIVSLFFHKNKFATFWVNLFLFSSIFCITASTMLLIYYQFTFNFQYAYVFNHISRALNPIYLISALWAGQEGSFLLWAMIAMWINLLARGERKSYIIYTLISTVILVLAFSTAPFSLMNYIPTEGNGLNKALQDPWMVIHPPLVFIGYSAMGVLFSQSFSKINRRWVIASLLFLGAGIFSGSLWAYRALGWGGYWAWDHIENAALIPFLILTAIVHKKKIPPSLAMIPFILAVFGTFLARSGIIQGTSVHSYTSSSITLPLLIVFILSVLILIVTLLKDRMRSGIRVNFNKVKTLSAFRYIIYIFAVYILFGTVLPVFLGGSTEISFYTPAALSFAIFSSILFTVYMRNLFEKNFLKIIIINTIIIIIISATTAFSSFLWLIILWIVMLPLIPKIVFFSAFKNIWAHISHIGVLMLITGTITSSVFSEEGILIQSNLLKFPSGKTTIIHKFLGDTIITESLKYTTRPFIWLFWLGGFMILGGILGALCFPKIE
ncbi:cytochrome c biogenesis protein CcsA [Clostridium sp.]|uniref:cytochrome c biogenesis protein CcsA n=1 Tax=Clostridium sp. TaxID=1506 RepID=UPI001A519D22|nr:cytochrome c biogenesis protein CcsA [Clostridium sp.]MBK5243371.1 cytochrome c biogenesis protein CcsA [Clostridium sp.]